MGNGSSNQPQPPSGPSSPPWPVRLFREVQKHLEKRRAKQKQEAPADRAAKSTARATWAIATLTVVAILVGVSQYIIFGRQLVEMRRTREASDRPWLQAVAFNVERLQITRQNVYIWTDLKLRNVGHSPALDIHIAPVLMPSLSTTEEAFEVVQVCKEARGRTYNFYNSVVFPGQDRTYYPNETSFDLDIASVQRRKEAMVKDQRVQQHDLMGEGPAEIEAQRLMNLPLRGGLTLLGCVTYKSVTDGEVHTTSFGLDLSRSCPEARTMMCSFEFSQPSIVLHDDMIERALLGASYAD